MLSNLVRPTAQDGDRPDHPTPPTGEPALPGAGRYGEDTHSYEHLAPLFAEHGRRPAEDPRRAALRAELITACLPVARNIARRYRYRGENPDDLEQVATVGLIKAVDRFDAARGVDFLSFAVPTITGEVQRHYRDRSTTIRVPRRIRQLQSEVVRATEELRRGDGHAPRPSEIAHHLHLDVADVLDALEGNHRAYCTSLDEPFPGDGPGSDSTRYAGALSCQDADLDLIEDRESLRPLLDALPDRERQIVLLRFFGNLTQSEIADRTGVSQMHVSRLLARTLAQLRAALTST